MLPTVLSPRTRKDMKFETAGRVVYLSPFCPLSQDTGIWKREDTILNGAEQGVCGRDWKPDPEFSWTRKCMLWK